MKTGQNDRGENMENKNKGFSLLEFIIIIAIMGVVLLFATPRVDSVFGYSAREANSKVYNAITSYKVACMGKSRSNVDSVLTSAGGSSVVNPALDMYMEIYKTGNGIYYVKFHQAGEEDKVEKLGPKRINISYQYKGSTNLHEIGTEGNGLFLAFDRATGGFIPQSVSGSSRVDIKYIYCSSGTKTYKLELMPNTGKVIVDKD